MSYPYNNKYPDGYYPSNYPSEDVRVPVEDSEDKPNWKWGTHICSTLTMIFCCWCACISSLFGMFGLIFSVNSYTDYKTGDYERYKYKRGCAIGCMLTGMILGLGAIAVAIYYGYTNSQFLVQYFASIQSAIAGTA